MHKKSLLVFAVLILLSGSALAFQKEHDGFRDLKWGDPPTEDMVFNRVFKDMELYFRPDDKVGTGDGKLVGFEYVFWNNKFISVGTEYKEKKNYDLLKTIFEGIFGIPTTEEHNWCRWVSFVTVIELRYFSSEGWGYLSFSSAVLSKEWGDVRKKEAVEKPNENL